MKQSIIKLEDGEDEKGKSYARTIVVRELRFRDAIKVANNLEELFTDLTIKDLSGDKFELFKDLIKGIVDFPKDEEIEDMYFSELDELFAEAPLPKYVHMAITISETGGKLSKRERPNALRKIIKATVNRLNKTKIFIIF